MLRRAFLAAVALSLSIIGCRKVKPVAIDEPDLGEPQPLSESEFDDLQRDLRVKGFGDEPTLIDPVERIARAMSRSTTPGVYRFLDPITLSIVASIIGSIVRYCVERNILSVQRQVQRRPDGRAAAMLRDKMSAKLSQAKHGDVKLFRVTSEIRLKNHVDAAMDAFARATPDELRALITDLADTPASDDGFTTSLEWSQLAE